LSHRAGLRRGSHDIVDDSSHVLLRFLTWSRPGRLQTSNRCPKELDGPWITAIISDEDRRAWFAMSEPERAPDREIPCRHVRVGAFRYGVTFLVYGSRAMRGLSARTLVVGTLLAALLIAGYYVSKPPAAPNGPEPVDAGVVNPDGSMTPAETSLREKEGSLPQPKLGPKPDAILFRAEYDRGRALVETSKKSSALDELHRFNVVEMTDGSKEVQGRFKKPNFRFMGHGRLRGDSSADLKVGAVYTVRLTPSEETWIQIERGEEEISLAGSELEIVVYAESRPTK
jgi:hypothetical protein